LFSLTLVFHVVSAIVFLYAIHKIVSLSQEQRFWLQIWEASRVNPQKAWILDWPHSFLRKFCHTVKCRYDFASPTAKPCRIDLRPWIELDRLASLKEVLSPQSGVIMLRILHRIEPEHAKQLKDRLEESFERQYVIELELLKETGRSSH
jgi:hypothetical protein